MDIRRRFSGLFAVATLVTAALPGVASAQSAAEVTVNDTQMSPESVTSTRDGAIIFGSTTKGIIYRAPAGASAADAWIQPSSGGLQRVLGVLADDSRQTLWVCSSAAAAAPGTAPSGETAVKSFDLATGAFKASYAFPGGRGTCNDMAVARDGTLYATDTAGGRILRLKPGAPAMDEWSVSPLLASADGISVLGDGSVYVNTFASGTLVKIAVGADGAAGQPFKMETSRPIVRPDGMRRVGDNTLLLVEGDGHLDEVTVLGNSAEIKTLKDGFAGPTAVTLAGNQAYVLVSRMKVVAVPYTPSR